MNSNQCLRSVSIYLSILVSFTSIYSQPNLKDYCRVTSELGFFLYLQYGYDMELRNHQSYTEPNKFDRKCRDIFKWNNNIQEASNISDYFLYGFFLGSIPFSPFISNDNYNELILNNIEVLAINGIITNLVKFTIKRQRPYSYYQTKNNNKDSYKSFFSGHTSTAFAIGTSTAMTLSNNTDYNDTIIWATILSAATATGYFRIASDKHYMSDVLTGAIVGSFIGQHLYKIQTNRKKRKKNYQLTYYNKKFFVTFNLQ